jgi:peroxiredoxin
MIHAVIPQLILSAVAVPGVQDPAKPPPLEAAALMEQAAEACSGVRTAVYRAHYAWVNAGGAEPLVREAQVSFAKWPAEKVSTADGEEPATTTVLPPFRSQLGASVRMDFTDGKVYAYDGEEIVILLPEDRKVLTVSVRDHGEGFITGNVVRNLIQTPLLTPQLLRELAEPPAELSYEGVEEAAGVRCHVVLRRHPGNDVVSNLRDRWFFGLDDDLPRKVETTSLRVGESQSTVLEITDLRVNEPIPEGVFALIPPEGFEIEVVKVKQRPELLPVGAGAPGWTLKSPDGRLHSLEDYRGKLVVLDFWGTWCVPCIQAMPGIQTIHERFGGRGVAVFGISCSEPVGADPAALMERLGLTYGLLLDGDRVAENYHVSGYPTIYVIDEDGKVLYRTSGFSEGMETTIGGVIQRHLKKGA